ncbi:ABC transporter ATP-binding protein [Zavarzinia compransoris]|uniref:Lauroyl acyltransferase n=1 Tax=Zavarzinia compransoris TaxID=1264899 RepID=A0A317E6I1_9PROT|nr:ABC transporter ATP-binding protein [Zavarzinia compransoris]PWR21860.1 lauroyl acyltransferase [Zavarzinia compransoris]TDP45335.1 NitT/TauT family transport system ATP-binding protein [Zavarzinia compransoris]
MSAITVRNLWKEYDERVVLERINLEIAPRSFIALVGPSGCGKTTFLRMLLSEERPTRGEILIDGTPIAGEPTAERGVVFQRYSVFPHLTVLGNVLLSLEFEGGGVLARLFGGKRQKAIQAARDMLDCVGLAEHEKKYPAQLSGGMQQRLALAQTLIRKPRVLLLDEPFGALDPGIRGDIHALMRRLWNEENLTVVMVTHDLSEAFGLATRVLAFERPRVDPVDGDRYGAVIKEDIEVWPRRIAGQDSPHRMPPVLVSTAPFSTAPGRDDPAQAPGLGQDDLALQA